MSARIPTFVKVLTLLAALAPLRVAAQDNLGHNNDPKHHHYLLVDIGTFGGPESFVIPTFEIGSPNPVNSRGTTVGGAGNSVSTSASSNPVECGGIEGSVPFVSHAFKMKEDGAMTDLGSLVGDSDCSLAASINGRGEIAGSSENGMIDPIL